MTTATQMYALGLDQIATAIKVGGNKRTVLVQGHMGTGKSSLLNVLTRELPKHTACYFDCTTKDLGDITIPKLATIDDAGYVTYVTNEELGVHLGKPIVLMIDEYGKANPAVKNALLRLMLERKIGSYTLHPDSLVFATTNLGAEGVGDLLPPHARNRMTVINARKPSNYEWIEWGIKITRSSLRALRTYGTQKKTRTSTTPEISGQHLSRPGRWKQRPTGSSSGSTSTTKR